MRKTQRTHQVKKIIVPTVNTKNKSQPNFQRTFCLPHMYRLNRRCPIWNRPSIEKRRCFRVPGEDLARKGKRILVPNSKKYMTTLSNKITPISGKKSTTSWPTPGKHPYRHLKISGRRRNETGDCPCVFPFCRSHFAIFKEIGFYSLTE